MSAKGERVELRVPAVTLRRWAVTAALEGVSISEWIRRRCDEFAVNQDELALLVSSK